MALPCVGNAFFSGADNFPVSGYSMPSVVEGHLLARLRARHLALLVTLADTLSIHRAAARLHMTQPAASKSLRELETLFGTQLFERHPRGLRPTAATQIVIDRARIMLVEMQKLGSDLELIANGALGKVRVGMMPVAMPTLLSKVLLQLGNDAPRVVAEFHEGSLDWMLGALSQGKLDCVICRLGDGTAATHFRREALFDESVCIVARSGHPIARRKTITPAMLASADWIFPGGRRPVANIDSAILHRCCDASASSQGRMRLGACESTDAARHRLARIPSAANCASICKARCHCHSERVARVADAGRWISDARGDSTDASAGCLCECGPKRGQH